MLNTWIIIIYSLFKRASWHRSRWSFQYQLHPKTTPSQRIMSRYPSLELGTWMSSDENTLLLSNERLWLPRRMVIAWMQSSSPVYKLSDLTDFKGKGLPLPEYRTEFASTCWTLMPLDTRVLSVIVTTWDDMIGDTATVVFLYSMDLVILPLSLAICASLFDCSIALTVSRMFWNMWKFTRWFRPLVSSNLWTSTLWRPS